MSLNALKNVAANLERLIELEEAVSLSAYGRDMEREYEELDLTPPEWLLKSTQALREEIARRSHAGKMAEMRKIEAELESYKSQVERKNEALARLADLQKQLGMTAKAPRVKVGQ
jgi:hypothetical protein